MSTVKVSIIEFQEQFYHPCLPLKDFNDREGNSLYKSLPYWRRNKLLPFMPKGDWGMEVSLAHLIWLRILDNLRALGYPVKDTVKITDYFFRDAYENDLPTQNLLGHKSAIEERRLKGISEADDEKMLADIDYVLGETNLNYSLKLDISYLSNLIVWSVRAGIDAGILIYPGGYVIEKIGEDYFNHNGGGEFDIDQPHIYISIKGLLREFIDKKELSAIVVPYLLQDEERLVLKELRKKNIKELKILIQSEKIVRIDSQTTQTITDDKAEEIKRILHMKNYEEVSVSTRDNRTITFNRTTKNMTSGNTGSKV